MWINFSQDEIDAANAPYIQAQFVQKDIGGQKVPASAVGAVERVLAALEDVLTIRTFLVGERLSLADIAVAFSIQLVYRCNKKHSEELAKKYKAVYRHYNTVMRHPRIKEVMRKAGATLGPLR
ncbi:elongation factor 1-gamma [Angomonas deanei]|nr:elongation factor 1-gamma [Angomonas deanei]|eukprot:EPY38372.1 elongation factor 1-gamma [Angomonas deanei]